jgi:hypothetical protein
MNTSGRSLLAFTTKQPPMSSTAHGGGKRRAVTNLFRPQRTGFFSAPSFGTASGAGSRSGSSVRGGSTGAWNLGLLSGSTCTLVAPNCAEDPASIRRGGDWRRSGGEPRNSASSRRVNSPRSCWRLFGSDSASGSRVGTPGGGSPLISGAGRCAGLGTGRRMMLGSITTSFRPPTSTRCSILSRRTSLILRFPSSWTDSITPTRRDALRPRSHLNMCFFRYGMPVSDFIYCGLSP